MATIIRHCTKHQIKKALSQDVTNNDDDTYLERVIDSMSSVVETIIDRPAYPRYLTWNYHTPYYQSLRVNDLLEVVNYQYDNDTAQTDFSTHFILDPSDGPPYQTVYPNPEGNYSVFGTYNTQSFRITGFFGLVEPLKTLTTLSAGVDSSTTTITIPDLDDLGIVGRYLRIGNELLYSTTLSGDKLTLTVERGINGSTAASHSLGDTVYVWDSKLTWATIDAVVRYLQLPRQGQRNLNNLAAEPFGGVITQQVMDSLQYYMPQLYV